LMMRALALISASALSYFLAVMTALNADSWFSVARVTSIYRGRQSNDAEDGLLAAFTRTRGRFSIVPGWMKLSLSTLG
jgi:hypothetical protein